MVAATAARGLSAPDLDTIRATLHAGRKPKVVFTEAAGQIAGQTGQVVALLDQSHDEWIVVRFGRDELPFSPADLAVPLKASTKVPTKRAARAVPAGATVPVLVPPAATAKPPAATAKPPTATAEPPVATAEPPTATAKPPAPAETTNPIPPPRQETIMSIDEAIVDAVPAKPARRMPTRQPKVRPPAALTVTIAYTDGEWSVGAQQGAKALAKPYLIKAAEALRMVAMLDVPGVHEAVEQIVAAERAETMAHAERLRAELADVEARLAELPVKTTVH